MHKRIGICLFVIMAGFFVMQYGGKEVSPKPAIIPTILGYNHILIVEVSEPAPMLRYHHHNRGQYIAMIPQIKYKITGQAGIYKEYRVCNFIVGRYYYYDTSAITLLWLALPFMIAIWYHNKYIL